MKNNLKIAVVGGGAAGFFSAINLQKRLPTASITIFEKQKKYLSKVKVSGGGRCNVTHAEFDPKALTKYYPRGEKELLGPFNTFCTGDMMAWLDDEGVPVNIEEDGRVFPATNDSQTIIDCFQRLARDLGVVTRDSVAVKFITFEDNNFILDLNGVEHSFDKVIIATGSAPSVWRQLADVGISIVEPVPSLFSFHIEDQWVRSLSGLSVPHVDVTIRDTKATSYGPILFTHKGLSGPAILKSSSREAVRLAELDYRFSIRVDWVQQSDQDVKDTLNSVKQSSPNKQIGNTSPFDIPKRLFKQFLDLAQIDPTKKWAEINKKESQRLIATLNNCSLKVIGRSPNKEEFVTAGGVDLKEINFKKFEAKKYKGLYFAGEVLNIDALTGGFNFQAAWTAAWIISQSIE